MPKQSLISVIIPVYNVAAYLPRCINSIMEQTYQNLEIILVDDGSTDDSPQICDEYATKDKRIKVFHQKNQGVSTARNTGLNHATGEFIGFVDADDWIDKTFYKQFMQCQQQTQADLVRGAFYVTWDTHQKTHPAIKDIQPDSLSLVKLLFKEQDGYIWNKLYRRSWVADTRFEPCYSVSEDWFFISQLAQKGGRIAYLQAPLYFYYQRDTSTMHNLNSAGRYRELQMWKRLRKEWEHINLSYVKETLSEKLLIVAICFSMAALLEGSKEWCKIEQAHALLKKRKTQIAKTNAMKFVGKTFTFLFIFFPHFTRWGCRVPGINSLLKKSFIKRLTP